MEDNEVSAEKAPLAVFLPCRKDHKERSTAPANRNSNEKKKSKKLF